MSWAQAITLGIACLGAILGLLNTWHHLARSRVRLRVVPKLALKLKNGNLAFSRATPMVQEYLQKGTPCRLCIEITNLSAFPITICEVGLGRAAKQRTPLFTPVLSSGKTWPPRLDSRETVTAYGQVNDLQLSACAAYAGVAYAMTDCGKKAHGTTPILKELVSHLQAQSEASERD